MSKIIGDKYEIKGRLGSGGGGIVYLGWHINLRKTVVLKADKRSLTANKETLRREVDLLKGLSNTYIPQVYDFIVEKGIVYTVMDYIEGKSFDKFIEEKMKFKQSDIVRFACQVLNALNYLHSQPPFGILHGDIKPANIMLRENGDICLIDYNIALALGEDGAVQVGHSSGYASPEHYGISYLENEETEGFEIGNTVIAQKDTEFANDGDTEKGSRTSVKRKERIKLDVRSDIYSLGATFYHIISGEIPAMDATEVVKLDKDVCSPALSAIISKAMHPVAGKRYQSAAEMLQAFLNLYKDDERAIVYRRNKRIAIGVFAFTLFLGTGSLGIGLKRQEIEQEMLAKAEYASNYLQDGDVNKAIELSLESLQDNKGVLDINAGARGQKVLTDALGVYNLSSSFESDSLMELSSPLIKIVESPSKDKAAFICHLEASVYDISTKKELARLKLTDSAYSDVCFLDDKRIIYAGDRGISLYDLETGKDIWRGESGSDIALNGEVAALAKDGEGEIDVYNAGSGEIIKRISLNGKSRNLPVNDIFADNQKSIFELNEDGSMLAISFADGSLRLYPLNEENTEEEDIILIDPSDYNTFSGGFIGNYFAFSASKDGNSIFAAIDVSDMEQVVAYESEKQVRVKISSDKIFICDGNLIEEMDIDNQEEKEVLYLPDYNIEDFDVGENWILVSADNNFAYIYSKSGQKVYEIGGEKPFSTVRLMEPLIFAGNRDDSHVRILKYDNRDDSVYMNYDPKYAHSEARISADGKRLLLFDIDGFSIFDEKGNLLCENTFPEGNNIFDQQYRHEGNTTDIFYKNTAGESMSLSSKDIENGKSWLEVIWYDGTVRRYDDRDGHLISEEQGDIPSKDLYEEFHTKNYKVVSELHAPPKIYDIESGKLLKVMENQDYLTYVTQIEDMLLLEYVRASVSIGAVQVKNDMGINGMKGAERYGVLLDKDLNIIGELPGLCDHRESTMYFDDSLGVIRKTEIFSLSKLKDMAKKGLED